MRLEPAPTPVTDQTLPHPADEHAVDERTPDERAEQAVDPTQRRLARSNEFLTMGATVGVVGVAGAVLLGATCPICVVAAPALLGAGVVERIRARRAGRKKSK